MAERVLITGAAGQDAAYLAKSSLEAGDEVVCSIRSGTTLVGTAIDQMGLAGDVAIIARELDSVEGVRSVIDQARADRVYNLAGLSSVFQSFSEPVAVAQANAMIPLYFLEAMRLEKSGAAFVQASTGEIFGHADGLSDEATPMAPMSPYAVTKVFAQQMVRLYRSAHGARASSAILFAHESPYRGSEFLTRKVTHTLARIRHGQADVLELGNLSAQRDWGYAGDYMQGMRLIASAPSAGDFVLASGRAHSVREFVAAAARCFGYELDWHGEGVEETGRDRVSGDVLVRVNPAFFRPTDAACLLGSPKKAEIELGWKRTMSFDDLVRAMAMADDQRVRDAL